MNKSKENKGYGLLPLAANIFIGMRQGNRLRTPILRIIKNLSEKIEILRPVEVAFHVGNSYIKFSFPKDVKKYDKKR